MRHSHFEKFLADRRRKTRKRKELSFNFVFHKYSFPVYDTALKIIHRQDHYTRNDHYNTDHAIQCLCVSFVSYFCSDSRPK